jgi:hypothetical protein
MMDGLMRTLGLLMAGNQWTSDYRFRPTQVEATAQQRSLELQVSIWIGLDCLASHDLKAFPFIGPSLELQVSI